MEDVLQYIIVIIAVIVAIISKVNKQKKADASAKNSKPIVNSTENEKTKKIPGSWEKWLDLDKAETEPVKQEAISVAPKLKEAVDSMNKNAKKESEQSHKEKISKKIDIDNQSEYYPEIELSTIDDVRRAIIYSEIINRKY